MLYYFAWFLVICSGVVMFFLIVRFFQPEMLYTFRHALNEVKARKLFRDRRAGRVTEAGALWDLLGDDLRYESRDHSEQYVHERVNKVRKIYRVLSRRPPGPEIPKKRKPQACIVELAGLLNGMARHMKPEGKFHYPTTDASQLLGFIANEVRKKRSEPPLTSARDVEEWFTRHPISIEQTIEVLIAAVLGLAYRQREQQTMSTKVADPDGEPGTEVAGSPLGLAAARNDHKDGEDDGAGPGGACAVADAPPPAP